jgi:ribosome biogenesis GTPase A
MAIEDASKEIVERYKKRGLLHKTIKAMIAGIPNVGKSTLINSLAKKKSTKTGNIPGITKAKQWIRLTGNIELLDTPGILWPKFINEDGALNLAFSGAIRDEVLVLEEIAFKFVERMRNMGLENSLLERYGVEPGERVIDTIDNIAIKRACVYNKTEIDYLKVSRMILKDFRDGNLGRMSLERPKML